MLISLARGLPNVKRYSRSNESHFILFDDITMDEMPSDAILKLPLRLLRESFSNSTPSFGLPGVYAFRFTFSRFEYIRL